MEIGARSQMFKERLAGFQRDRFIRNVKLLLAVNCASQTGLSKKYSGISSRLTTILNDPTVEDVDEVGEMFQELPEDLIDEDLFTWPVNTLLKDHLREYWEPKWEVEA